MFDPLIDILGRRSRAPARGILPVGILSFALCGHAVAAGTCVNVNLIHWQPPLERHLWGWGGSSVAIELYDREGAPKLIKRGTLAIDCDLSQRKEPLIDFLHAIVDRARQAKSDDLCEGDQIDVGGTLCKIKSIDLK